MAKVKLMNAGKGSDRPVKAKWRLPLPPALDFLNNLEFIGIGEFKRRMSQINMYRMFREVLIRFYLKNSVAGERTGLVYSWQPFYLIALKIAVVTFLSLFFYTMHTVLGDWLQQGFMFFRLHEIYNFKFPDWAFFKSVASYLFLFIIGYYCLYFGYYQIQALFSSLILDPVEKKLYYIHSVFVKKDLYIFNVPEMEFLVLKQNLVSRLFGLGTIVLQKKSGEQIVIRTVRQAGRLVKDLTRIRAEAFVGGAEPPVSVVPPEPILEAASQQTV